MADKLIDKIQKKIDKIEHLHDKESMLCEEVKDLLEELREEKSLNEEEEDFDETEIEDEELDEQVPLRVSVKGATHLLTMNGGYFFSHISSSVSITFSLVVFMALR